LPTMKKLKILWKKFLLEKSLKTTNCPNTYLIWRLWAFLSVDSGLNYDLHFMSNNHYLDRPIWRRRRFLCMDLHRILDTLRDGIFIRDVELEIQMVFVYAATFECGRISFFRCQFHRKSIEQVRQRYNRLSK
jgi:hypothetical protein